MANQIRTAFPVSLVFSGLLIMALGLGLGGCKERIVDVQTPRGGVTVDRDTSTGAVEVDVDVNKKRP